MRKALLQVARQRIMQRGTNAPLGQEVAERFALLNPDDIAMVYAFAVRSLDGKRERRAGQHLVVTVRQLTGARGRTRQMRQVNAKRGALDSLHAGVVAILVVVI